MVRGRFDKLEAERQERVLGVAADEFAEKGYEAASLNRIIERAGMSKGSLYYYFDDKADLFATVVERATARIIELLGGVRLDALTAESYWPSFDDLMRRSSDYLTRNTWYVKLARSLYRLRGKAGKRGAAGRVFRWMQQWIEKVIARGQELGVVRTDLPLSFLGEVTMAVGEVGDRWILDQWDHLSATEREAVVSAEMALFRRLLEPEGNRTS